MSSNTKVDIGPPADEAEINAFAEILSQSLTFPTREKYDWVTRIGADNLRLARVGSVVAGGLVLIHMGQWFGGRPIPMVGIHAVGVAPDHRGSGVGSMLMREIVRELKQSGVPLSTLYPATQPVYRSVGYERAGVRVGYRIPAYAMDVKDRALDVVAFDNSSPAHRAQVESVYRKHAAATAGNIDRRDWNWKRVFEPWNGKSYGYLLTRDGDIEGYLFFMQSQGHDYRVNVDLIDQVTLTPAAGRRAWSLLADHQSVADWVTWFGPPADAWTFLLREQLEEVHWRLDWMLRLVDVKAALEARGYRSGVSAEVHLDIHDDLFPENSGKKRLVISDGGAEVTDGGDGRIRVDVRGLAALYTGHLSAHDLTATSLIDASEGDLESLGAVFAGPAPWMADMF